MTRVLCSRMISVAALAMAPLHKGCAAFGALPVYLKSRTHRVCRKGRSHCLSNGGAKLVGVPSPIRPDPFSAQRVQRELKGAIGFARVVERKYGLCHEQSQKAWDYVDEIYQQSQSAGDGSGGRFSNFDQRDSPRRQTVGVIKTANRAAPYDYLRTFGDAKMKGTLYFF